ncbi:MAG: SpoIIE family protein phosphatase [Magnetococcales bacterium]|uniref:SpoIIE family protein phosphatase n=1 Tax=Candidatus Magnetobacterium casense TaxID=1455061 RepID=A0ABS6RW71_9BACT|nr:SpoIIE family protein phosphatase [Candidatus Magnetobacterium casensis]MBF0607132.1 SpoIIE family protein phosphatase [Nitrospirota bacterium]MBV6340038.1 SpoIIE family protein phosphatase [Candidatus Magnetobacterium casensis]
MSDELDDLFQDSSNGQDAPLTGASARWKVMIVDDEPGVHEVTLMILKSFTIENRGLEFISAYTGREAIHEITKHPDTALIFLDVVMENDHAGLDVVKYIRETLKNRFVRIVLRTGQPGLAPEESIIVNYDINDYKEKNELQRQKLITSTVAAIRSYRDIMTIDGNLRALEKLIESSKSLFDVKLIDSFFSEVLVQLNSILTLDTNTAGDAYSLILTDNKIDNLTVISGAGVYEQAKGKRVAELVSTDTLAMLKRAFEAASAPTTAKKTDINADSNDSLLTVAPPLITCLKTGDEVSNMLLIENRNAISQWDRKMIDIFCTHASMYFSSVREHKLEQSLKLSRDIQMNMLPTNFSCVKDRYGIDLFAFLQPAREVGGDLYDFFPMDDTHLCFAIGDVSDKGVHAALIMSAAKTTLRAFATLYTSPDEILGALNKELCAQNSGMFVTFFLAIIDVCTGEVTFSNAGHNPPYLLYASDKPKEMKINADIPLGIVDDFTFTKNTISLKKGDGIFIYTDGITDAIDANQQPFDAPALERLLSNGGNDSANHLVGRIVDALQTFIGDAPQFDDITMLVLKYGGESPLKKAW